MAVIHFLDEIIKRVYSEDELKKLSLPQLTLTFGILTTKGQEIKGKAPQAASNLQVNINFDPGMLPESDGSKHLEKIEDSFTVNLDGKVEPTSDGSSDGTSKGSK